MKKLLLIFVLSVAIAALSGCNEYDLWWFGLAESSSPVATPEPVKRELPQWFLDLPGAQQDY